MEKQYDEFGIQKEITKLKETIEVQNKIRKLQDALLIFLSFVLGVCIHEIFIK